MKNRNNVFNEIFTRLLGLGIQSQKDLADKLKVSTSSVNGAKKRGSFPKKWISILCQLYGKSPEWLLGNETQPDPTFGNQDKDEIISLLKEQAETLKKEKALLEEENIILRKERDTFPTTKKVGKNYLNQREAAKAEKEDVVNY